MDELIRELGLDPATVNATVLRELGQRYYAEPIKGTRVKVDSPAKVAQHFRAKLAGETQEHFAVLALDSRLHVIDEAVVCKGGQSEVHIRPREIFRVLLGMGASAALVVHNHPSGSPDPSPDDIGLTRRLVASGELLGVPVVDHLVVASGGYVSIRERMPELFAKGV